MSKNPSSMRVLENVGMTYESNFPQHIFKWDTFEDLVNYGLLRSTYLASG
jgi:RimJ/RimL family protein N-acetyltransferase